MRTPATAVTVWVLLMFFSAAAPAGEDWQVASHHDGITVYTRHEAGHDLKDFRGVVRVKASMRDVVATLVDVDAMPAWFFDMRSARVLETGGPQDSFIYVVMKGFWPVQDRDAVVQVGWTQDPHTLVLSLKGTAAPEHYPPMRERVRIPRMSSGWTVTPLASGETEVRLDVNADPGGNVPVWLANLVVVLMPEKTLENLRARLESRAPGTAVPAASPGVEKLLGSIRFPEPGR
jgi:hypothetical protein